MAGLVNEATPGEDLDLVARRKRMAGHPRALVWKAIANVCRRRAEALGVPVEHRDDLPAAVYDTPKGKRIVCSEPTSPSSAATLMHELKHVELGHHTRAKEVRLG